MTPMPSKKIVRNFKVGSYYYIYNHGFSSEEVFTEETDYETFLSYLSLYLLPLEKTLAENPKLPKRLHTKSLNSKLNLIAYCLLPTSFQLLVQPTEKTSISNLLKQLTNAYTYYFNKKYNSIGPVFHGRFKSVEIQPAQLPELVRYLHFNPTISWLVGNPKDYQWSSHKDYLKTDPGLVKSEQILSKFPNVKYYEQFILNEKERNNSLKQIKSLIDFRG